MKMPNSANVKETLTRTMFHILNIPRLFCTMTEWTNAVSPSHGISAAFSIGSHAQ